MNKDLLKTVIADQDYYFEQAKDSVKREFADCFCVSSEIVIITGIRRCGKSTLLQQIRAMQTKKDYYINFDDDRLVSFKIEDFQMLLEVFYELFGEQKTVYYHNKGQECDFLLVEEKTVTTAIQVIYVMPNEKTRKREIDGLLDAMNTYQLQSGLIITDDTEDEIIENDKKNHNHPCLEMVA